MRLSNIPKSVLEMVSYIEEQAVKAKNNITFAMLPKERAFTLTQIDNSERFLKNLVCGIGKFLDSEGWNIKLEKGWGIDYVMENGFPIPKNRFFELMSGKKDGYLYHFSFKTMDSKKCDCQVSREKNGILEMYHVADKKWITV